MRFLAVFTFSGSPPEVRNRNPAYKMTIGATNIPIVITKLISVSINSSKDLAFKGFAIVIA